MHLKTISLSALGLALLLAGCSGGEQPVTQDAAASAPKESTAWWKNDGKPAAATAAATNAAPKPGWAKLAAIDTAQVDEGRKLFDAKGCVSCHTIGKGDTVGPDLLGVTTRVEPDWLHDWLKNPDAFFEKDEHAKQMLTKYLVKMPNLSLTDAEVKALSEFLRQADAAKQS